MSNKLASLGRDLDHIRKHRVEVKSQRERLASRLSELNKDLKSKKISYELYESKYNYILGGKTTEEKKKYFKKRLDAINHREKDLIARIKHETHAIKNKSKLIAVTAIMFAIIVPMISIEIGTLTGFTTYNDTSVAGKAVIPSWHAIELTPDPAVINFPDSGPSLNDINADLNNLGSSAPGYYLELSADSNEDVQTCLNGAGDFSGGGTTMSLGNLAWDGNQTGSSTYPILSAAQAMTTTKVRSSTVLEPGDSEFYRFWLDTPADQLAASYSTTITFTTVGGDCTA